MTPHAAGRGPDDVVVGALASGLLDPEDVVWHDVEVVQLGSSHPVHRIGVDGVPRAVVKVFGPRAGDTDGDPAREHAVRRLGRDRPAVGGLLAPEVPWEDDPAVVASAFVDAPDLWQLGVGDAAAHGTDLVAGVRDALDRVAPALVPALAGLHRGTRDLAPGDDDVPWVLRLFDGDAPRDVWATRPLADLLASWAGEEPGALRALREARGRWRPMCLVHGDLTHANVLVRPDGGVVLLDWEMSRVGDPAWDVAALLAPLCVVSTDGGEWSDATLDCVAALLRGYAGASRLPAPALARRVVLYVGAWLLMTAVQVRSTRPADPAGPDGGVADGVDDAAAVAARARRTLGDVDTLTAQLLARLDVPT